MKVDSDQLVSGYNLSSKADTILHNSVELFSFDFQSPASNIQLQRPPYPFSRLCTIKTNQNQYIEANSTSGSISLSNANTIGANNYFYVTILPNTQKMRICSATNNCYFSIGEDTLIYCHIESAIDFQIFLKVCEL